LILHLGKDRVVAQKEVVMIFDYERAIENKETAAFLKESEKNCEVVRIVEEGVKSVVLAEKGGRLRVYYSPVSVKTLSARKAFFDE